MALEIARKLGFEIMARLPTNEEVGKVGDLMVEMLKNDPENLIKDFISELLIDRSKN